WTKVWLGFYALQQESRPFACPVLGSSPPLLAGVGGGRAAAGLARFVAVPAVVVARNLASAQDAGSMLRRPARRNRHRVSSGSGIARFGAVQGSRVCRSAIQSQPNV
ncbi:hypothetical protein GGI06_004566, partial [Coemansia sp. S85]